MRLAFWRGVPTAHQNSSSWVRAEGKLKRQGTGWETEFWGWLHQGSHRPQGNVAEPGFPQAGGERPIFGLPSCPKKFRRFHGRESRPPSQPASVPPPPRFTCSSVKLWNGIIVAGYGNGQLHLYEAASGALRAEVGAHARWIYALDLAPASGKASTWHV